MAERPDPDTDPNTDWATERRARVFLAFLAFLLGWIMRQSAVTFGWGYTISLGVVIAAWMCVLVAVGRRERRRGR